MEHMPRLHPDDLQALKDALRRTHEEQADIAYSRKKVISDNTLFTPDDLAEMLNKDPQTINRYFRDGILKGSKIGQEWRLTKEQFKNYLDETSK